MRPTHPASGREEISGGKEPLSTQTLTITILALAVPPAGDPIERLRDVAVVLSVLVAIRTLGPPLWATYRRTLGRRADRYKRLSRLGTGAQLSFFEAVLGEPPAILHSITGFRSEEGEAGEVQTVTEPMIECFFVDRDYYVQTISDELTETVVAFSVTTRRKRFRPCFTGVPHIGWWRRRTFLLRHGQRSRPLIRVCLGKTRFSGLGRPANLRVAVGARAASYSEAHYYGNPGYYQTFVLTASTAGVPPPAGPLLEVEQSLGNGSWDQVAPGPDLEEVDGLPEARRLSVVTTYTVIGPNVPFAHFPTTFGPHGDEVRTLP